jgi:hypothetical protein
MSQDSIPQAPDVSPLAGRPQLQVHRLVRVDDTAGSAPDVPTTPAPDVVVRDYFTEFSPVRISGVLWTSPDIIPYGSSILDAATAISTYEGPDDIGAPLVAPGTNNIWIRAKNLWPNGTETATAQLYYSSSSLLMSPDQWVDNQVLTASGNSSVSFVNESGSTQLALDDICITEEAFYLSNLPPLQGESNGEHYCLIAVVNTPNTNVSIPPSFSQNATFMQWVESMTAVAWRNITVVPNTLPEILQTMLFGSQDNEDAEFHFTVLGNNLPVGTTVQAQCTSTMCPINQTLTMLAPDEDGNQLAGWDQSVPGNFQSALEITVTPPPDQSFAADASLTVTYYQHLPANPTDVHMEVGRFARIARVGTDGVTRGTTQFLVRLGQCTTRIVSAR